MRDIIIDTLIDGIKLFPFLFFAFLVVEYIEHSLSNKNKKIIEKSGKFGPLVGGLMGLLPQCGFSVLTTNLYVTKIVSLGTLISVYLTTSDELLPILISERADFKLIVGILLIKLVIGVVFGYIIDALYRKKLQFDNALCEEEHCHCNEGILLATLRHSIKILIFIMIISFVLSTILEFFGNEILNMVFIKNSVIGIFLSSLIGLIPNCGASVIITELYLKNVISFASLISGLLTGCGVAILLLFKINHNFKENIKILLLLYFCGVTGGLLIELLIRCIGI